jgi:hypothetical protein
MFANFVAIMIRGVAVIAGTVRTGADGHWIRVTKYKVLPYFVYTGKFLRDL